MLRLVPVANGEEIFDHTGMSPEQYWQARMTREDMTVLKIPETAKSFLRPNSRRCPVEVLKDYLSHLNPNSDALFQKPKELGSAKFNPAKENIWCESECKIGHNTLENLLRKMTERAGVLPDKPFIESDNSHCSVWKKR